MTTDESLGYLKGLLDGLDIDESSKEGKVLRAVIDVLENIVMDIDDTNEDLDLVAEQLDELDDALTDVEDYLVEEGCGSCTGCDGFDDYDDMETYLVECPSCHEEIEVDEETILEGSIECPSCGEILDLDVTIEDE